MNNEQAKAYQETIKVLAVALCRARGLPVTKENVSSLISNAKKAADGLRE